MVEIVADKFIVIVDESTKLCDARRGPGLFSGPTSGAGRDQALLRAHDSGGRRSARALKGKCKPVLRMGSSSNNQNDGDNIAVTDKRQLHRGPRLR